MNIDQSKKLIFAVATILICIGVLVIVLNTMDETIYDHYENTCIEMGGTHLTTYSGCSLGGCEKEAGTYCVLPNGTEIDITIREAEI